MGTSILDSDKDIMNPKDLKPYKLKTKEVSELQGTVDELQKELSQLRVNKVSSGVASKLAKIRVVQKAIARSLTYINFKKRDEVKEAFKVHSKLRTYNEEHNTNWRFSDKPYACRENTTRAKRRALTKKQRDMVTLKAKKRAQNFPQRSFAVRA